MSEHVWFIAKPGEERKFATPREPSQEWTKSLKEQGYRIFRVDFNLPEGWDSSDAQVEGKLVAQK